MERTLVLIKPDAMQRGLAGEIIQRLEQRGLKIAGMKLIQIPRAVAEEHYGHHSDKPFFRGLVDFITSTPVIAAVFEGHNAIKAVRQAAGLTNPLHDDARSGSIRSDFGLDAGRNLIHASDAPETAAVEIARFFRPEEVIGWSRATDPWIFE